MLKLVNGVLQLRVQHLPVSHHNHRVKHLLVCRVVQAAQAVRQPGNGVGLARARRVLHQVVAPRPMRLGVGHQLAHCVQLVVAREDHGLFVDLLDALVGEDALVLLLQVHKAAHDVQQAIALPHLAPQVGRAVAAVCRRRVARMAVVAQVKGQEERLVTTQPCSHEHLVLVYRKVHQRTFFELKQQFARIAVALVLALGVFHRLARERVLQFRRGNGQTVQKQHQVQRLAVCIAVIQLACHRELVVPIQRQRVGVHGVAWRKHRHPQLLAIALEALAQHLEHALGVQLFGQMVQHHLGRIALVDGLQAVPHLRLGGLDKAQHQRRVQRQRLVIAARSRTMPIVHQLKAALAGQAVHNGIFQPGFSVLFHSEMAESLPYEARNVREINFPYLVNNSR